MAGTGGIVRPTRKKQRDRPPVTKVVSLKTKSLNQQGYKDLVEWLKNPDHVYIGRDMTHYVPGAVGSKWHNPFTVENCPNLEARVDNYKEHVEANQELYNSLPELEGKTLGCWCKPGPCHGDELVMMLKAYKKDNKLEKK